MSKDYVIDKYTLEAMNRVIEYNFDAEAEHYEEYAENSDIESRKNHIFNDIKLVSDWLDNNFLNK